MILRALCNAMVALSLLTITSASSAEAQNRRTPATEAGYDIAFVDADIKRVADAVLGAMLGVDYSVDPAVVGIDAVCVNEYTAPPTVAEKENDVVEGTTALTDVAVVTT